MTYKTLEVEIRDRVATLWMNRPDLHNAFDEVFIQEMYEALTELDGNACVRVVVLAGRGKSFCAGADLNWMTRAANYTVEENLRDAQVMARMFKTLHRLSKPTIARVHGAAFAGGVGLTAACDIAVVSTAASFAITEVRLGMIPSVISPYVIAAIGRRMAHRYFLTAERFGAEDAERMGMAHIVCAPEALDAKVAELAGSLIASGPLALVAAKDLISRVSGRFIDNILIEDTAQRIAALRSTPQAKEGIGAFLEKRKPRWETE